MSVLHLGLLFARPLLDFNVAKVEDSSNSPEELHLLIRSKLQDRHSILQGKGREGWGQLRKKGGGKRGGDSEGRRE